MELRCDVAAPLVPTYLDGELSEELAHPLRRHLLACHACREAAQGEQALKRWFPALGEPAVPSDFAARVARRAFAGDTGWSDPDGPRDHVHHDGAHEPALAGMPAGPAATEPQGRLLSFVTGLTAVAAAVLFVLALAIRGQDLPDHSGLSADDTPTFQEVLEDLESLNEAAETEFEGAEEATADGAEGSGAGR